MKVKAEKLLVQERSDPVIPREGVERLCVEGLEVDVAVSDPERGS